jgi:hypothetical protein
LPFVFTSGEGLRTDTAKPEMIRFVKMAIFSEVQRLFSIRKAADLIAKVHTIRFVGLPFVFASHGGKPKLQNPFWPPRFLLVCVVVTVTF